MITLSVNNFSSDFNPINPNDDKDKKTKNKSNIQNNPKLQEEILKLKQIDAHVKAHEAAHKAVGGDLAGNASYTYKIGPDGKRYAVSGEVPISIKKGNTPQETIINMQRVKAAALAPSDPSAQDLKVAATAEMIENEARMKLHQKHLLNLKV